LALLLAGPGMSPFLLGSLGASTVILFVLTESPAAQPRALLCGHLSAAVIGIACQQLLGDALWVYALALGLSLAFMLSVRVVHPPAGANALIMVYQHAGWSALLQPVLIGVLSLGLVTYLWSRLHPAQKAYPVAWNQPSPNSEDWGSWRT
jgi:CBS-domain-containing membrane protein